MTDMPMDPEFKIIFLLAFFDCVKGKPSKEKNEYPSTNLFQFLVAKQLYEPLMSVRMYLFMYVWEFFFPTNTFNISAVTALILMKVSR